MRFSFLLGFELLKQRFISNFTGKNSNDEVFEKARMNRMVFVIVQQKALELSRSDTTNLKNELLWLKSQSARDFVGKKKI